MTKRWLARATACAVAASGIAAAGALVACTESEAEKMAHGDTVDDEVAMPTDPAEMKMTEEERRAKAAAEDEALERKEFNDSGQGDNAPTPP